jgi:hypothetical protein
VNKLRALDPIKMGYYTVQGPQDVYLAAEVDAELARLKEEVKIACECWKKEQAETARLRELCAEHETCVADHNLKDIELASLRERVGELQEAIVWMLRHGIVMAIHHIDGVPAPRLVNNGDYDSESPPDHLKDILAPLIAEAQQTEVRR